MTEKILNAIKELKEKSKKRNFPQTFDLIVNLKEFDVKKPENKFSEDFVLPHGKGKESKVVVFADEIKTDKCEVAGSEEIQKLAKNKRAAKKVVRKVDFFLAEPKLMPLIGKALGVYLGPAGKMPKIISGNVDSLVENYKKSIRIKVKDSPVIQCSVGNEKMKEEDIAENIESVLKFLETKLPKGKHNIKEILLKLTMGKPIRVEA
jgi:large subunit ribosomal protein L1